MNRPKWSYIHMIHARMIACRSVDTRLKVGCVIVSEDNTSVLSVGYNGDEAGGPGIPDSLEPGKSNFVHAEINAGLKLDYNFPKKKIMYVTHFPCRTCCRAIVNMGISTVVYDDVYRDMSGKEILERSNVEVRCIKELCHECDFRFEAKLLTV